MVPILTFSQGKVQIMVLYRHEMAIYLCKVRIHVSFALAFLYSLHGKV